MRQRFRSVVAGATAAALAAGGALGAAVVGANMAAANDVVVLENDFETTYEPWGPRGPVTLAITDDARTGTGALEVTGRTGEWNGPATSVVGLFEPGGVYQVEAWVKLPAGTAGTTGLHFTVQETRSTGDSWTWVGGAVQATADGWVQIGGAYTMPSDLTAAQLYVEAAPIDGVHPSFLVDDLVITGTAAGGGEVPDVVPGGAIDPTTTPVVAAMPGSAPGVPVSALTFDDGPNPSTTPELLDFLAEHDLKAVFCVIGQNIQAAGGADILRRIVAEGHVLCNHSTSYADMGSWTAEQVQADMVANMKIIRDALGDPNAKIPFWRAPNGSWGVTPAVAVQLGMQPLAVTNVIFDWETQDVATLTENLRTAMKDGELVLAHDGGGDRSGTLAAVETVVTERLAEGWEFTFPEGTPPFAGVVLSTDFEDGTLGGWVQRHGTGTSEFSLAVTDAEAHESTRAALLSGRDSEGDGVGHDVTGLLTAGVTYDVSAWVKFAPGQQAGDVWLSLANTADGATSFQTLGQFTGLSNDAWTQVTATFTMPPHDSALLYFETAYQGGNLSDWLIDDIVIEVPEPPLIQDLTPLKDTVDFPAGVAIDSRETSGAASDLLLHHFDQITPENHMKPEAWYDAERNFRPHPEAVALMDFASANGLDLYGHVLVWHSQTPAWFFQDAAGNPLTTSEADKQVLRERMRTHIFSVAEWLATEYGAFGGGNPLTAFDVVNEVVSDGATSDPDDGLRRSEWYRILGEEYIDLAFRYADEAFNQVYAADGSTRPVTLFINDYNTEQSGKQDRYRALVDRLIARDVPIDGVGHQFHVSLAMPISALEGAIVRFADLPVTQAVTELDVTTGTPVTDAKLIEQGYYYRDAFRVFREHAAELFCVTVWGLTDGRSWRSSNGDPLLFDDSYQAKPAYHGAVDGDVPARVRTANVFAGSVAVDDAATTSLEWSKLPLHQIAAAGESVADFQLRWAPDHLTAYVAVHDADPEAGDAVTLELDGATAVVGRDGSATGATAVVEETEGGYALVAHLPLAGAAEGDTLGLDVRVTDGEATSGWNTPGSLGTLTLLEELSYLEVVEAAHAPAIDGEVDDVWAPAGTVTTAKEVLGTGGAVATVRTLWRDSTLFVLADVADPVVDVSGSDPWIQDSVEIYVDAGNAKNGSYRYDDTQIRINAENVASFGTGDEAFQRARLESATVLTDGGYRVEAAISLLEYGGEGTFHGLDFQVNDASDGTRTAIRNWADPSGVGYQSTARWGVGQLVPGIVNLVPPSVTGDAVKGGELTADAGEWSAEGVTLAYRWLRDGEPIVHDDDPEWAADGPTYKVKSADVGHELTVEVTATADGFDPVTVVSDPVEVLAKK